MIHKVLVVGYVFLIFLIFVTAYVAGNKIQEISTDAEKTYDDFNRRESLAQDIRYAAANVIVESRLVMATRNIRIPVPPFKINYNNAKKDLDKKLSEGRGLWGNVNLKGTISQREIEAWGKVELSARKFWESLMEIEKKNPEDGGASASVETQPALQADLAAAQVRGEKPEGPAPRSVPEDYRDSRGDLEKAALDLARSVAEVRREVQNNYTKRQQAADGSVKNFSYITIIIGLVIAAITTIMAQSQIVQLRRTTRRAVEAEGIERSVTDSQRNFIVVLSERGEMVRANKSFHEFSNTSNKEMSLQDYRAVFAHMPEVTAFVWKALQDTEGSQEMRERIEVKPRSYLKGAARPTEARLFDVRITPLKIEDRPFGRVVVIDDITDAEKQREEIRRNRTLSAVGTITAQVAHELYNPIGAVKLNLELLEMQVKENDDVKNTIGRLKRGVEHLSTIVMDLRYLTKPRDPERKPTDINKLLDEVIELANDRLERSRIRVVRDYSITVPQGNFDLQQLRKVFLNLVINAVEASPQNGEIKLRTRFIPRNDTASPQWENFSGALAVSVIDHGIGMSPETKRRLFEAFYTTKRNGTGLGMMITQEILKKHSGRIDVESEEGKGTRIHVYLPV